MTGDTVGHSLSLFLLDALLVGYLPGALFFRLPVGDRPRRAALSAGERGFWGLLLSVAWSVSVVFVLAAFDRYRFPRLIEINAGLCLLLVIGARGRLRLGSSAARPSWAILVPLLLVGLALWRFFPPSEYIIGGKDPGTYMNEGIQIAQRGSLTIHDPDVAAVPPYARDLFFPSYHDPTYDSVRFMGFFVRHTSTGEVIGQFPQLYPASIAIGYGLDGLSGARLTIGVWGLLGLLAVYFSGARFVGRTAAAAAAILLSLNVAEVWFARYPNTELVMQPLLFAGTLAFARAHHDRDRFFAPVAAGLIGLLLFARVDGWLVVVAIGAAAALMWIVQGERPSIWFVLPLAVCGAANCLYLAGPLRAYAERPIIYLQHLPVAAVTAGAIGGGVILIVLVWLRQRFADRARRAVPAGLAAVMVAAAVYALFFRRPGGRLTDYNAYALKMFAAFYLQWLGLVLAIAGLVVVVLRRFWRDAALVLVFASFSLFFFYKIEIVPDHFWAARRFLPVILPGALIFAAAAALDELPRAWRRWRWPRAAAGAILLVWLGQQYVVKAAPIMPHVEYAGIIPYLERLAGRFGDRDLVIVESRNASDTHVLGLPLAYIYARHVLVLNSPRPDKLVLRLFLADALKRYAHVFFLGAGGTDLLSREIVATPVAGEDIQVPEYESAYNAYPTGVHRKEFDYGIYELSVGHLAPGPFTLDVGYRDDLNVVRFHAKEVTEGRTIRWTGPTSYVSNPGHDRCGARGRARDARWWTASAGAAGASRRLVRTARPQRRRSGVHAARQHGRRAGIPRVSVRNSRGLGAKGRPHGRPRPASTRVNGLDAKGVGRGHRRSTIGRDGRSHRGSLTSMFSHLQIHDARERWLVGLTDVALAPLRWRRPPPSATEPRRVLLLRLERIGDLLMVLDAIRDVRAAWPTAEIDLVVGSWNAPLANLIADVTRVETLDVPWLARGASGVGWPRLLARARAWRHRSYDVAINFEPDIRSNLFAWLSGARRRYGYWTGGGGALLTTPLAYDLTAHVLTNARRLAGSATGRAIAETPEPASGWPRLIPPPDAVDRARTALGANARPLIGVHVSGGRESKQWHVDRFTAAARILSRAHDATIVLTGAPADRALVDLARQGLHGVPFVDVSGALDLPALAALLAELDLLITGDTGPMHLAAAMNTPVVALFGPSDPRRYGPLAGQARVLRVDLPCSPCGRVRLPPERCRGHVPDCMDGISVDAVVAAGEALLQETREQP